jgi:inner membrane protein
VASAFSHAIAAGAIGAALYQRGWPARVWMLGAACSILPDADVIGVAFGIPFRSVLGHRGLSHSLLFAAVVAALVLALGFRRTPDGVYRWRLGLYFFLATASHGVLDALTNGGPGIAFFAPFDNTRYFFPWRPVVVSPLGIRPFFSEWGLRVIESELVWIGLPSMILAAVAAIVRRRIRHVSRV